MNAKLSLVALALLVSLSSFAEDRSLWKTSSDVREGVVGSAIGTVTDIQSGNRFVIAPDDDKYTTILVDTDAMSTRWNGFGGTINGSPEIFVGSAGFPNLRTAALSGAFLTLAIVIGEFTLALYLARPAFGPYLQHLGQNASYEPAAVSLISFGLTWIAMGIIAFLGRSAGGRGGRVEVGGAH